MLASLRVAAGMGCGSRPCGGHPLRGGRPEGARDRRAARRRNQEGSLPNPDRPSSKSVQFYFDKSVQF